MWVYALDKIYLIIDLKSMHKLTQKHKLYAYF